MRIIGQRAALAQKEGAIDFEPVVKLFILAVFESINCIPIHIFHEYPKE
jgi:hypothetical protein